MKIIRLSYPDHFSAADMDFPSMGQVLAIGYFDGVHLGHQHVIKRALDIGQQEHLSVSIMTFHPHPKEVLGQVKTTRYLTPLEEKIKLFEAMGVDQTYVVSFDLSFSQVSPEQFVRSMLAGMRVKTAVVGFNFTFGYLGKGTTETLRELGQGNMGVEVIQPYRLDDDQVSSTLIRERMSEGHIENANRLLGRDYCIAGMIVCGEGRGRTIGVPTANIELSDPYVVPRNGVYAVKIEIGNDMYKGVMNIGIKPTFVQTEMKTTLEVHIFHFNQDIYGKEVMVHFISFLRHENKFSSVEKLVEQIHKDIDEAHAVLH